MDYDFILDEDWRELIAQWLMTFGDREVAYEEYGKTDWYVDSIICTDDMADSRYFTNNGARTLKATAMKVSRQGLDFLAGAKRE